jgi:hypothetical protein
MIHPFAAFKPQRCKHKPHCLAIATASHTPTCPYAEDSIKIHPERGLITVTVINDAYATNTTSPAPRRQPEKLPGIFA